MNFSEIIFFIFLTILTGLGDSQGFIHASRVWDKGVFVWGEAFKSAGGFALGTAAYWIIVKFLQHHGVVTAEIQTLSWFAITIIGVSLASGKFFQWTLFDQILAASILFGIGVLMIRTNI